MQTLIRFWQDNFGVEFFHIQYENLVKNPDFELKRAFDFLVLDQVKRSFVLNESEIGMNEHYPSLVEGLDALD